MNRFYLEKALRLTSIVRILLATLLLASVVVFREVTARLNLLSVSLIVSIVAIYLYSVLCSVLLLKRKFTTGMLYVGFLFDAALACALSFMTGYKDSPYLYLFLIIPLYGGLTLKYKGALVASFFSLSSVVIFFKFPYPLLQYLHKALRHNPYYHDAVEIFYPGNHDPDGQRLFALSVACLGIGLLSALLKDRNDKTAGILKITHETVLKIRGMYGHILDALPSAVLLLDKNDRKILYFNRGAKTFFPALVLDEAIELLLPQAHAACDNDEQTGVVADFSIDDSVYECHRADMITPDHKKLVILHIFDVTDIRREQENKQKWIQLERLGRVTSTMAHEIRNPLASIRGAAEMLDFSSDAPELKAENTILKKLIVDEADRLNMVVTSVLTLARKPKPHAEICRSEALILETVSLFSHDPNNRNIDIVVNGHCEEDLFIDVASVKQILLILWRNAAEAVNGKGRIEIEMGQEGERASILTSDSGHGIADEHAERIFEPFFSFKKDGNGLGLATARQFAEMNGGMLSFEGNARSERCPGASFKLLLPISRETASGEFQTVS